MDDVYNELAGMDIFELDELKSMFINFSTLKDPLSYNGRNMLLK